MKVTNNTEINKYLNETSAGRASKTEKSAIKGNESAPSAVSNDDVVVELSRTSQEIRMAHEVIEQQPEMRREKTAALKAQIENGTYEIDSKTIADKMMKFFMDETG